MSMENVLIELTNTYGKKTIVNPAICNITAPTELQSIKGGAYINTCDGGYFVIESYDSIVTALEKAGYYIIKIKE